MEYAFTKDSKLPSTWYYFVFRIQKIGRDFVVSKGSCSGVSCEIARFHTLKAAQHFAIDMSEILGRHGVVDGS